MKRVLVWILCITICFGMFVLVGCGSSEDSESADSSNSVDLPITVEDNDIFTFEITDRDDFWGDYTFRITNKSDQDITFEADNGVINDSTTVDLFIYSDISAGTNTKDTFYLDETDLSDFGDDEELTMKIPYKLINSNFDEISSGEIEFVIPR